MTAIVLEIAEISQFLPPVSFSHKFSNLLRICLLIETFVSLTQSIVTPLFQTLAALNVLMYMLGSWGFNVIVKTFKGLERSEWNRRMVSFDVVSSL